MAPKRNAPYDERNARDFQEMSRRIADALEEIALDPSIPATQRELTKRAKCSPNTLRNREWPVEKLKSIAAERKEHGRNKPNKITREHRITVEVHIEDKKRLLEQLNKSRTEAAVWFDRFNESENAKKKDQREKELLLEENRLLKARNADLEIKVVELKATLSAGKKKKTVLRFPRPDKKR